jgi:hypothetical protein
LREPDVDAKLVIDVPESAPKRRRITHEEDQRQDLQLLDLPTELLLLSAHSLSATDLAFLDLTCKRLRLGKRLDDKWKSLYEADFNGAAQNTAATPLQLRAATLAGSWKELYRCRLEKDREARRSAGPGELPWEQPCKYELDVALNGLMAHVPAAGKGSGASVMFLLDGSGSVTEDDFRTMTQFIGTALASIVAEHPLARVGILQFSNDVRIELQPQAIDREMFDQKLATMTRINGGTNISLAISKAGQLLKSADAELLAQQAEPGRLKAEPGHSSRVLVLLTDGRVDAYQAHEAVHMMERLADEQANVSLHAFGVGRGVDKTELLRIIAACGRDIPAEDRYTGLRVLDEAPW